VSVRWVKRGRVIPGETAFDWGRTHAMLPVAEPVAGDVVRVYFSSRDGEGRGHIGVGELELQTGRWRVAPEPVLRPGAVGAFDESGVQPACLVCDGERRWLYYTGWTRGVTVPFYFYTGLALSGDDGRTFVRHSRAPILERSDVDPFLTASPSVCVEPGVWRMWYVSCVEWEAAPAGLRHRYHIKYAESADGRSWRRDGRVCIDFASPDEYALGRPCVRRDRDGRYRMWFCARGDRYRLALAESHDGLEWTRVDRRAGLDVSPSGWDSEMVAYPWVFEAGERLYMLYNGNGYGRTGIGLAEGHPA
jgi:hypothetical protein